MVSVKEHHFFMILKNYGITDLKDEPGDHLNLNKLSSVARCNRLDNLFDLNVFEQGQ